MTISMDTFGEIERLLKAANAELNLKAEFFGDTWVWQLTVKREHLVFAHVTDADLIVVFRKGLRMLQDHLYRTAMP